VALALATRIGYNAVMKPGDQSKESRLTVTDCGISGYDEVLGQQNRLHEERHTGLVPDTVLIVEHTPVITLGARQSANKLLTDPDELAQQGIHCVQIRRGGGTTAHNPGQLVFYPILDLGARALGISEYIRSLESIGIELLGQLHVNAERKKGFPGLWVGPRKIASIGVRVSRQITYHGMAINIQNDLQIFGHFVPCGLDGVDMTSVLRETGRHSSMPQIKQDLTELLRKYFAVS
jgi:lipoyl(octanoyl) transferase